MASHVRQKTSTKVRKEDQDKVEEAWRAARAKAEKIWGAFRGHELLEDDKQAWEQSRETVRDFRVYLNDKSIKPLLDPIYTDYADFLNTALVRKISYADVEYSLDRFTDQVSFCNSNKLLFPCLLLPDGPVPIDWNISDSFLTYRPPLGYALGGRPVGIAGFSLDKAVNFYRDGLWKFLDHRRRSGWLETPPTPGIPAFGQVFRVYTKRGARNVHRLRVHYTKAYHPETDPPVFGEPSSPVAGIIQAGIWMFGTFNRETRKVDLDLTGLFEVPEQSEGSIEIYDTSS